MNQIMSVTSLESPIIQLELVLASGEDLKELDFYKELPNGEYKPVFKRRQNLPYWLKSFETNKIESKCYFLRKEASLEELSVFLKENRVFIHKDFKKMID